MVNKGYTTGKHGDSGSCPSLDGGECMDPERRKKIYTDWGINIPTAIAFVMMLGSLIGYIVTNERRMTENKESQEVLKTVDKGIIEHAAIMDQMAIRDRMEMRDDIKEVKSMVIELVKRPKN